MIITFPWPPKELSPNARVHWAKKAKVAAKFKADCIWLCHEAKVCVHPGPRAVLVVTYRPPSKRRADIDNMVASSKQIFDALSWSTAIDDSNFSLVISKGEPIKGGAVEVEIQSAWGVRAGRLAA